jgi:hypothetical protein
MEPPGFKRLTLSLVEMALITGVVIRLLRAITSSYAGSSSFYLAAVILLGAVVLFGMTALHLANFTLRHWLWRAPAFALLECVGEMITSAILILVGREPIGTDVAVMAQWWSLAVLTVLSRVPAVCLFAALLAGVIQVVRRVVIAKEPDARAAARLREELFSEAAEPEIEAETHQGSQGAAPHTGA